MDSSDHDLDRIADLDGHFTVRCRKILDRGKPFALIAEVDKDAAVRDTDDLPFDKLTRMVNGLLGLELVKNRTKIDVSGRLFLCLRGACGCA